MTRLLEITRANMDAVMRLDVADGQDGLVAPNSVTLAQVAYEQPGSYVWALGDDAGPVGLLAMVHPAEYPWPEEGDDPETAFVWRLMVDAAHQGKGHGRAALRHAFEITRGWGFSRINITVVDKPTSAIALYEAEGFRRTGRMIDGEIELLRSV